MIQIVCAAPNFVTKLKRSASRQRTFEENDEKQYSIKNPNDVWKIPDVYHIDLHQYQIQTTNRESFMTHNFQVDVSKIGDLRYHTQNCSTFVAQQIVVRCQDGWIQIGQVEDFMSPKDSKDNYEYSA